MATPRRDPARTNVGRGHDAVATPHIDTNRRGQVSGASRRSCTPLTASREMNASAIR